MVQQCLSPHLVIGFEIIDFLAFFSAVKVDAVQTFVISMAERHKVWLVFFGKSYGDIFCGFQYLLENPQVGNFLSFRRMWYNIAPVSFEESY